MRVGSKAEGGIKVGDRVGVGAQSESCLGRKGDCEECASNNEPYCPTHMVGTYNGIYMNGGKSYGGYALYNRAPSHFVIKIPDAISSAEAAPMLCGGITSYSPLRHNGCGPGKKVGIVGVGGLGHFGIMFAKALGADRVVAISRKDNKKEDALKLGADAYIATDDDPDWAQHNARSLDLIVSTVSSSKVCLCLLVTISKLTIIDASYRVYSTTPYQRFIHPAWCSRRWRSNYSCFLLDCQEGQDWWFIDWRPC